MPISYARKKELKARREAVLDAKPSNVIDIRPGIRWKITRKVTGFDDASLAAIQTARSRLGRRGRGKRGMQRLIRGSKLGSVLMNMPSNFETQTRSAKLIMMP